MNFSSFLSFALLECVCAFVCVDVFFSSGCSLKKEFIYFIHMNPSIVLCQTMN